MPAFLGLGLRARRMDDMEGASWSASGGGVCWERGGGECGGEEDTGRVRSTLRRLEGRKRVGEFGSLVSRSAISGRCGIVVLGWRSGWELLPRLRNCERDAEV
jgi:hypothetical protein